MFKDFEGFPVAESFRIPKDGPVAEKVRGGVEVRTDGRASW